MSFRVFVVSVCSVNLVLVCDCVGVREREKCEGGHHCSAGTIADGRDVMANSRGSSF